MCMGTGFRSAVHYLAEPANTTVQEALAHRHQANMEEIISNDMEEGGAMTGNKHNTEGIRPPTPPKLSNQRMVDEITCHCDILGRLMQEFSGETMAHDARVRAHMASMEHSPFRRVRARREGDMTSASGTAPGP